MENDAVEYVCDTIFVFSNRYGSIYSIYLKEQAI